MDDTRILDKLDNIGDRMARIEEKVAGLSDRIDKYNDVTGRTSSVEYAIETMRANCARVQDAKKRWQLSPGQIIGGIAVGVGLMLIGALLSPYLH
jgi:hypothetical protein